MENIDYINKLRDITAFVKVVPYFYVLAYFVGMGCYLVGSETLSCIVDQLLYVAPLVVVMNLVFSRLCELCKWHRTACVVPLFPTTMVFVDNYAIPLSDLGLWINVVTISVVAVTTIVSAYYVFIAKPKNA